MALRRTFLSDITQIFWDAVLGKLHVLGNLFAFQLALGTSDPNDAAIAQMDSTTQGLLPPRMTTTQRNAIASPPAGLQIFNTTTGALEYYDGASWETVVGTAHLMVPLFDYYTNQGNVTTGETDLYTSTTAANRLGAAGDKIEAEYGGVFVASATATRQIKFYFAGTAVFDTGALTLSLSSAWTIYATLIRVSSSVVRYMISLATEGAALSAYTSVGELTSIDLTTTNIIKITGQAGGVGAATNDIVAKMGCVEWRAAA